MLTEHNIKIITYLDARKEQINEERVWEIIRNRQKIFITKGTKVLCFEPSQNYREEILKKAIGRTGTLRAPTLILGGDVFIGYNQALFEQVLVLLSL